MQKEKEKSEKQSKAFEASFMLPSVTWIIDPQLMDQVEFKVQYQLHNLIGELQAELYEQEAEIQQFATMGVVGFPRVEKAARLQALVMLLEALDPGLYEKESNDSEVKE